MTKDLEYTFNQVDWFNNAILPTKAKADNELIDSWTDILYNAEMKVDGVYGEINKLITHNDTMLALQPKAVVLVAINPRVQTVAADGISIELGSGNILHDYQYLTTTSGTLNRFSVLSTQGGLYYYDALNNILCFIAGGKMDTISKKLGMNSFFKNSIDLKTIIKDNPFISRGIWLGYDPINDQVLTVSNSSKGVFTLAYGENTGQFTTFLDYHPKIMLHYDDLFLTDNGGYIYSHYTGDYNNYYGTIYPSKITLLANIGNPDNIFNVLEYRSESYLEGVEVPNHTFTSFRLYNEYQDTGTKATSLRNNLFKKFRNWRIVIPRDQVRKLDRIRGPWTFIELSMLPAENYKFICHNITVHFEDATIKA